MKQIHLDEALRNVQPKTTFAAAPAIGREDLTWLDVVLILARRKRFILVFAAICSVVTSGVTLLLPNEYTAIVTVLPPQQTSSLGGMLAMQLAGLSSMSGLSGSGLGFKNQNDTYVAMLRSRTVEDAVIRRFGLMQEYHKKYDVDARKALEWHTEIDGSKKDGLIRLKFENRNPARAAAIANGYVEEFKKLSEHLAITEAAQRRIMFEQQLEKAKDNLANAEEALKETQLSTGMVQIDAQSRAFIESAARLRAQVIAQQVKVDAMRGYAANDNPALIQAQRELNGLNDQYNHLVGSQGSASDDLFLPRGKIPEAGLEYVRRLRDVKYYEAIFDILARQLELAKLDEAKEGGFIQVVDAAVPPGRKSFPKRALITLGAAFGGLSIAILIVLFQAGIERMSGDPDQKEKLYLVREALGLRRQAARSDKGTVVVHRREEQEIDQTPRVI